MKNEHTTWPKIDGGNLSFEEFEQMLTCFVAALFSGVSESAFLHDLARNCVVCFGFENCSVYLLDEERELLVRKAVSSFEIPTEEIADPVEIPVGTGVIGEVARSGTCRIIGGAGLDGRYTPGGEKVRSAIFVPIIHENKVLGVLESGHPQRNHFTLQHQRLLSTAATIGAWRIRHERVEHQKRREFRELAELKANALRANLSPHFVFNALNAIQYYVSQTETDTAIHYLSVFSRLIRYHLNHCDSDTVLLKDELNMLESYLTLQRLRYEDQFDFRLEHQMCTCDEQVRIPALVLSSLVEHAVEQSMLRTGPAFDEESKLHLSLELADVLTLRLSYRIQPGNRLQAEYREHLLFWEDRVQMLNRLKHYGIKTETFITPKANSRNQVIDITISMPILRA